MKRSLFFILLCTFNILLFAQQYAPQYYTEYEPNNGRTKNHVYEYAPDKFLAIRSIGNCIDGVFVGPVMLGVDCDSLKEFDDGWIEDNEYPFMVKGIGYNNDSLLINRYVEHPDTVFDGVPFKFNIILNRKSYKNGKKIDWMTLEDIKKKYFPEAKERCIYTVNKFIIPNREKLYKFDPEFIYRVEMTESTDIETLKDLPEFSIIRIFTKTKNNYQHLQPGTFVQSFSK